MDAKTNGTTGGRDVFRLSDEIPSGKLDFGDDFTGEATAALNDITVSEPPVTAQEPVSNVTNEFGRPSEGIESTPVSQPQAIQQDPALPTTSTTEVSEPIESSQGFTQDVSSAPVTSPDQVGPAIETQEPIQTSQPHVFENQPLNDQEPLTQPQHNQTLAQDGPTTTNEVLEEYVSEPGAAADAPVVDESAGVQTTEPVVNESVRTSEGEQVPTTSAEEVAEHHVSTKDTPVNTASDLKENAVDATPAGQDAALDETEKVPEESAAQETPAVVKEQPAPQAKPTIAPEQTKPSTAAAAANSADKKEKTCFCF